MNVAAPETDGAADWLEEYSSADVVITPDGVLLEYNRAAARMFRLAPGEDAHGLNVLGLCTDVPSKRTKSQSQFSSRPVSSSARTAS